MARLREVGYTKKPWYMKLLLFKQEEIPIATGIEKLNLAEVLR